MAHVVPVRKSLTEDKIETGRVVLTQHLEIKKDGASRVATDHVRLDQVMSSRRSSIHPGSWS